MDCQNVWLSSYLESMSAATDTLLRKQAHVLRGGSTPLLSVFSIKTAVQRFPEG